MCRNAHKENKEDNSSKSTKDSSEAESTQNIRENKDDQDRRDENREQNGRENEGDRQEVILQPQRDAISSSDPAGALPEHDIPDSFTKSKPGVDRNEMVYTPSAGWTKPEETDLSGVLASACTV